MINSRLLQFYYVGKYVTIQAAVRAAGYNRQNLRRLLRTGKITGLEIGQVWLIELVSLEAYTQ